MANNCEEGQGSQRAVVPMMMIYIVYPSLMLRVEYVKKCQLLFCEEQKTCRIPVIMDENLKLLFSSSAFKFQENLLKTMLQIENTFFALGESCTRDCLIICDRGTMDASACMYTSLFGRCVVSLINDYAIQPEVYIPEIMHY
jgi:hypothetical protein